MGKLRKISSILLAAALLFSMAVPAVAATTGDAQNMYRHGDFEDGKYDDKEFYPDDADSAWRYSYFTPDVVDLTTLESEDAALKSRGGKVLQLTRKTNTSESRLNTPQNCTFTEGHTYLLRFWYYYPEGTTVKGKFFDKNLLATSYTAGAWTLYETIRKFEGTNASVSPFIIAKNHAATTVFVDDILLMDLSAAEFDGSMETNDKWTVGGEASINAEGGAYEGEGMMMLDGNTTVSQIAYMGAVEGSDYMLKGLVKTDEGYTAGDAEIRVYAGVKDADSAPIFKKSIDVTPVWSEVLADNLIASTNKVMTVEIVNKGGACVYFDAFTLGKTTNLVPNSGFEREQADSETSKWPNTRRSDEDAKNGEYSLAVTRTNENVEANIKDLPCKPNTKYRITYSLKTKTGNEASCSPAYCFFYRTADSTTYVEIKKSNSMSADTYRTGEWVPFTYEFTTAADAAFLSISLRTRGAAGTVYYDDVGLYDVYPHENAFRTADGDGIYEVYAGMPTSFTAKYAWTAEEAGTCLFVVGLYKEVSGKKTLEKVFLKDCEYTTGDTLLSQDITWDAVNMEDGATYSMKCMVWDDMTTLNPAEKVYSIRSY